MDTEPYKQIGHTHTHNDDDDDDVPVMSKVVKCKSRSRY